MPLKSLTLNGFKSFADKTKIEFTSGITGIVGPNGSGKSNITEGIRWVMGEQSAKSLRGDKMIDVIFAGSSARTPMNRTEVILEFDNSKRDLKTDIDNVVIKRRLFRDGNSEFYINNKNCRLKDITELFLDSGLGRESFSIISQGRVESIFNSKPVDRRTIIEESAGVSLYKQKKHEAELKLTDTDDNLNRVSDILHELSSQVEPLKEQSSIAHDYLNQKKQYDKLYKQILAIEIFDLNKNRKELSTQAESIRSTLQKIDNDVKKSDNLVKENRNKISEYSNKLDQKNKFLLDKSRQLEIINGQRAVVDERNEFNDHNQQQIEEQIKITKNEIKSIESEIFSTENDYNNAKLEVDNLKNKLQDITNEISKSPDAIKLEIENLRSEYLNVLQEQTTRNNNIKYLTEQNNRITNVLEDSQKKLNIYISNKDQKNKEINVLNEEIKQFTVDSSSTLSKYDELSKLSSALTAKLSDVQNSYTVELNNLQKLSAKKKALEELSNDHAGFFQGVKSVLNNKNRLNGIIGAVAEVIEVPKNYQVAIEVASGNQLQSIITTDEMSAKNAISFLRKGNYGRSTFLPRDVIKPRKIDQSIIDPLFKMGLVGVASDLLKFDANVKNVVENIFGNLLIADNLDNAVNIAKVTGHRFRIVTMQGDILNPGGSLTGGQVKQHGNSILSRNQEINDLNDSIKKLQLGIDELQIEIDDINNQIKDNDNKLSDIQIYKNELENKKFNFDQTRSKLDNELNQIENNISSVNYSIKINKNEEKEILNNLNKNKQENQDISEKIEALKSQTEEKTNLLDNYSQEQEVVGERIQTYQTQIAVWENTLDNKSSLLKRQKSDFKKQNDSLNDAISQLEKLKSDQEKINTSNYVNSEQIDKLTQEVEDLKSETNSLKESREILEKESEELSQNASRNFQLQKNASQEQENISINLTKINNSIDSRLETLNKDYSVSFEETYSDLENNSYDVATLKKDAKLLKLGISELGNVNISSIEEYDKVKDRYEFLTQQESDLLDARTQLKDTMNEMDEEVSRRFKETFDDVAASFEVIFPEMFAGGKAKLILTDPENLLETGIEIIAQPPGKKFQRLSLLSGGERALTAITLLFAIIKVKPVPFCILDEVEAALDDANVYRFAKYLNKYDDNTQFIVITHRKGTMMNVNRLYGVSMEELGVSKMVSIEVKEDN